MSLDVCDKNRCRSRSRAWGPCAALAIVAALIVFHSLLAPPFWPKLLLTGDYHWYHGPQAFNLDAALHDGEFPLWNPLTFCGQPFVHNPQVSALYPPNLLRSLLNIEPTPAKTNTGLLILVLAHIVIAAWGTYALARDCGIGRGGAVVSVLAYVFGPTFVRRALLQWVLVAAAAWLPWQILFLRRMLRAEGTREKLFYGMAGALTLAMNILAGFPQLVFGTAIMMGAFFLLQWAANLNRAVLAAPAPAVGRFARDVFSSGMLFVLALLLAAAVLLPAAQFAEFGGRARGQGFEVEAASQDLSPAHLLRSMIVYPGDTAAEQGCRGAGLIVLMLAAVSLAHRQRRDVLVCAALFYIMTDCTLGPPFPVGWLADKMDVFQFSSPWRAGILAGLPLALLAGFGLDAAVQPLSRRWQAAARAALLLVAGLVPAWFLLQWTKGSPYVPVGASVVAIPVAAMLVLLTAGAGRPPRLFKTLAVLLLFAEIAVWNNAFIPGFLARQSFHGDLRFLDGHPGFWQDNYRFSESVPNMNLYRLAPAMNGYDPMRIEGVRQCICDPRKARLYFRFVKDWESTSENERGNLLLKRSFWLARQYVRGPLPQKSELFPPTTTVFFPGPVPQTEVPEVSRDGVIGHAVSNPSQALPLYDARALAAYAQPVDGTHRRLSLPAFELRRAHGVLCIQYRMARGASDVAVDFADPGTGMVQRGKHLAMRETRGESAVLEIPLPAFERVEAYLRYSVSEPGNGPVLENAWLTLDSADEDRLVRIVERRRNSVEVALKELPAERVLLFLDAMYPGWSATVDGRPVPIFPADDVFKAVVVPKGSHRVRFDFSAPLVWWGVGVSLFTFAAVVLAMLILRGNPRRASAPDSGERLVMGFVAAGFPLWFPLRVALRLACAPVWLVGCYLAFMAVIPLRLGAPAAGRAAQRRVSRVWVHGMRAILGIRIFWVGQPPGKPYFLVTNHLSWQDFFALMCSCDAAIVAQAADEGIPLVGRLMGGLDALHCPPPGGDATACVEEMVRAIGEGKSLVMAPEGIVGPGREVRTFHPDLLEPAVRTRCPVHYLSFTYRTPPGCPPPSRVALFGPDPMYRTADGKIPQSEIDAWGPERPFLPHLLGVLALPWHEVVVHFGDAPISGDNAAVLARDLQDAVQRIFIPVP